MAAMQTTMIRASMTAYSTAVGPSSAFRNFTRAFVNLRISFVPLLEKRLVLRGRVPPRPVCSSVRPLLVMVAGFADRCRRQEPELPAAVFNETLLKVLLAL